MSFQCWTDAAVIPGQARIPDTGAQRNGPARLRKDFMFDVIRSRKPRRPGRRLHPDLMAAGSDESAAKDIEAQLRFLAMDCV